MFLLFQQSAKQRHGNGLRSSKKSMRGSANLRPYSQSHIRSTSRPKTSHRVDRSSRVPASHARVYLCDRCSYTCSTIRNLRFHQVCNRVYKLMQIFITPKGDSRSMAMAGIFVGNQILFNGPRLIISPCCVQILCNTGNAWAAKLISVHRLLIRCPVTCSV